jgi:hypothetical protein
MPYIKPNKPGCFINSKRDSDYLTKILSDYPSSNRLLLPLFSQPNLKYMSIKQLIAWSALFEHEPATIRVAAGRLVKQGFLIVDASAKTDLFEYLMKTLLIRLTLSWAFEPIII